MSESERARLDRSQMVLWGSFCGVHTVFTPAMVEYLARARLPRARPSRVPKIVVDVADGAGSTSYLWKAMTDAKPGDKLAIATEGHFVRNAREQGALRGVEVVNMADVPREQFGAMGCGCATMSRNDPAALGRDPRPPPQGQPAGLEPRVARRRGERGARARASGCRRTSGPCSCATRGGHSSR
jgi:quinolinate synthase